MLKTLPKEGSKEGGEDRERAAGRSRQEERLHPQALLACVSRSLCILGNDAASWKMSV